MNSPLHVVILAGGSGRRLWPWSRPGIRKPELPLVDDSTPLEMAVESALLMVPPERLHLVAAEGYLSDPGLCQWIREPKGRNTLPAIMRGAEVLFGQDPDALMIVLPADQLILDRDPFRRGLFETIEDLHSNPDSFWIHGTEAPPSSDFGCISFDSASGRTGFVEKPSAEKIRELTEEQHLNAGTFKWYRHCGIFGFGAQFLLRQLHERGLKTSDLAPEMSIDHFLLGESEFSAHLKFRSLDHSWSDLGDWNTIRQIRSSHLPSTSQTRIRWSPPSGIPLYSSGPPLVLDGAEPSIDGEPARRVIALGMEPFELFVEAEGLRILGSEVENRTDPPKIIFNATGESLAISGVSGGLVACMDDLVLICSERGLRTGLIAEASRILDSELQEESL